ncbi:chaplin [Peterkaempfera sp. SMS 1(5)a]|uniref:chaplin n=1 Tax=Peterkaempfera podocarpi TaxID=3232308 RepID=UPI00366D33D6
MRKIAKVAALAAAAGCLAVADAGAAAAIGADAKGAAVGSPGLMTGNVVQKPISLPLNLCGNTHNFKLSMLNAAFGNTCINASGIGRTHVGYGHESGGSEGGGGGYGGGGGGGYGGEDGMGRG